MKKYLEFELIKFRGKTQKYEVYNEKDEPLGEVKWFTSWRKYCFFNWYDDTWYDSNCLNEISKFLDKLNREHKTNNKEGEG